MKFNDQSTARGTIVLIAMVHWHYTWQSQHNMASGLADQGYRVLFVEHIPKRWPRLSEFGRVWGRLTGNSRAAGFFTQPLVPGVDIKSPRMLPDAGPLTRRLNRRLFVPGVAAQLKSESTSPLIVINYLPTAASLALMEALEPDVKIYHCVNDWEHDPYAPARETEADLIAAVDMVWADSPVNFARTSRMGDNVVRLPHGVDIDLFTHAGKAPDVPPDRPLCAYFGTIGISTDIDLLRAVSHRFPLRLIGPVRTSLEEFAESTEMIGPVPHQQIPELLRDVDVLLLPYLHSPHNDSVMPAKLFECLATGKPTIACGLKTLYQYADLFYIRETPDEYLSAIAESVREPVERREPRIACAEKHSYARRILKIESYIEQLLANKQAGVVPSELIH